VFKPYIEFRVMQTQKRLEGSNLKKSCKNLLWITFNEFFQSPFPPQMLHFYFDSFV